MARPCKRALCVSWIAPLASERSCLAAARSLQAAICDGPDTVRRFSLGARCLPMTRRDADRLAACFCSVAGLPSSRLSQSTSWRKGPSQAVPATRQSRNTCEALRRRDRGTRSRLRCRAVSVRVLCVETLDVQGEVGKAIAAARVLHAHLDNAAERVAFPHEDQPAEPCVSTGLGKLNNFNV